MPFSCGIVYVDGGTSSFTMTDGSTLEGYVDGNITNAKDETVSAEVGAVSVSPDIRRIDREAI